MVKSRNQRHNDWNVRQCVSIDLTVIKKCLHKDQGKSVFLLQFRGGYCDSLYWITCRCILCICALKPRPIKTLCNVIVSKLFFPAQIKIPLPRIVPFRSFETNGTGIPGLADDNTRRSKWNYIFRFRLDQMEEKRAASIELFDWKQANSLFRSISNAKKTSINSISLKHDKSSIHTTQKKNIFIYKITCVIYVTFSLFFSTFR